MAIRFQCTSCGRMLRAVDRFSGTRANCPTCGAPIEVPHGDESPSQLNQEAPIVTPPPPSAPDSDAAAVADSATPATDDEIVDAEVLDAPVIEFLEPPTQAQPESGDATDQPPILRRMFEAMLDPRSIQWMLTLGGVLAVLGLIVWIVSLGIFENKIVVAVAIGIGTLLVLGAGWLVSLKTRYKTAGQALTFLGCVLAPLNLWYYHAQDLIRVDDHLWVGGVICCLLYIATVRVLRKPLFMYAVEIGVSLTVLLLIADLPLTLSSTTVAVIFMVMGLISIHAERAFPAGKSEFSRQEYGLPVFWSGHVQIAIALIAIAKLQISDLLWTDAANNTLLAAGIWLAAAYAYLYSDLVVRRIGVYVYLAALAMLIALLTLVSGYLSMEIAIVILAGTALIANVVERNIAVEKRFARIVAPLGLVLGGVPLLLGWILHARATSAFAGSFDWGYQTSYLFVGAMLVVALCNRASAWLYRKPAPKRAIAYLCYSAAALLIGAAGLLRVLGLEKWTEQAPLLMLIPLAYLVAARLWRGHIEERPLTWVAHAGSAIILAHGLFAVLNMTALLTPVQGQIENLLLGIVFMEAAVFYAVAAIFDRSFQGGYLSAAAACAAMWQLLGYVEVPIYLHTLLFAILGLALVGLARLLGTEQVEIFRPSGRKAMATRGRGQSAFQAGNAILSVAVIAAFMQGLGRLTASGGSWHQLLALALTTGACAVASMLVPGGLWRRTYIVYTIGLAGLAFLTLNVLINLSGWQKLEIFCTLAGIVLVVAGYIGRFTEAEDKPSESVDLALVLGGALATLPVLVAVVYQRFFGSGVSLPDEIAAITLTSILIITGVSWQVKSTTLFGGFGLFVYLCILVASLAYLRQASQGVYLVIGGAVIFSIGVLLSVYRDRLLQLPDKMAKHEGVFKIMNWR